MFCGTGPTATPATGSAIYNLPELAAVIAHDGSLKPVSSKTASLGLNFATAKVGIDATIGIAVPMRSRRPMAQRCQG